MYVHTPYGVHTYCTVSSKIPPLNMSLVKLFCPRYTFWLAKSLPGVPL